jgi:thiamine pyrophosphate-dependent acetolactate synthase large subunit-like protein
VTGARLLGETLRTHRVKTLFTPSGNQILSIYDATIGRGIDAGRPLTSHRLLY